MSLFKKVGIASVVRYIRKAIRATPSTAPQLRTPEPTVVARTPKMRKIVLNRDSVEKRVAYSVTVKLKAKSQSETVDVTCHSFKADGTVKSLKAIVWPLYSGQGKWVVVTNSMVRDQLPPMVPGSSLEEYVERFANLALHVAYQQCGRYESVELKFVRKSTPPQPIKIAASN